MQNLNRFVTYIYSYRGYEKDVNVGFAKANKRGDHVHMEIQIRKKTAQKERAEIYFLAGDGEKPTALPIGMMYFENETGIYKGKLPLTGIAGSEYNFEQVKGVYLRTEKEMFASRWVEEELELSKIIFPAKAKEESIEEEEHPKIENTKEEDKDTDTEQMKIKAAQESPVTIKATEEKPLYDWRYEWEKLDRGAGTELVLGLALWTRNKGKS